MHTRSRDGSSTNGSDHHSSSTATQYLGSQYEDGLHLVEEDTIRSGGSVWAKSVSPPPQAALRGDPRRDSNGHLAPEFTLGTPYEAGLQVVEEEKAQDKTLFWTRKKKWIAAVIAVLLVIAIVVGTTVGVLIQKAQVNESASKGQNNDADNTSVPTGNHAEPTTMGFGTPTSFASTPTASTSSACSGKVCQGMLTVVQPSKKDRSSFYIFGRGSDKAMWYRQSDGKNWLTEWESLGGTFMSQPAAVSIGEGQINIFGIWKDSTMRTLAFKDGKWESSWNSLDGDCRAPPTVCSMKDGRLDLFTLSSAHELAHKWLDNGEWGSNRAGGGWHRMKGYVASTPVATCRGDNQMDVTAYGNEEQPFKIASKHWNQTQFNNWTTFAGDFMGDPSAFATGDNETEYFGLDRNNNMRHVGWSPDDNFAKMKTETIGSGFESMASVTVPKEGRIDAFAIGTSGKLMHNANLNASWGNTWDDLGGFFNSAPLAVSTSDTDIIVFGIGPDGNVIHSKWALNKEESVWSTGEWFSDGGSMATAPYREGPA